MAPQSKRKYLENFANHLVSTYGSHPDVYGLTGEVYAVWWKKLKQSFDNIATRDSFTDNLRDYKTKAIYRLVEHMQCFQLHDKGSKFLNLDLNSILKAMLKDASSNYDLAMYRLLIALTYLSVGRGGEGKFSRWEGSFWDPYMKCFATNWLQTKTLEEDVMPYAPDKELFSCDVYHCFGAFFILCDGLYRDPNETNKRQIAAKNFIFPNLHSHQDEFVARKITELLTKYTPDAYKSSTTAKSLRIGSNTALAMHRDITFHMQQARGGWSTGSRSDIYQEICPQLTYYAGTCLSGWSNCSKIIQPPNLECLGSEDQSKINTFISHLYPHDDKTMPRFAPAGDLRPFIRTVTASVLRFHEEFIAHYGASHAIITKCFHAARKAGIASSDNEISKKLISWSKQIQDDFIKRNIDIHTNTNDERLLVKLVEEMSKQNHLSTQVVQLTTAVLKNQEDLKSRLVNSEVVFEAANIAVQQCLSALEGLLYERKKSPASQSLTGQKRTRIETDFYQQQNESSSAMSSKTDLVFQMDLETKAASVKETKAFWQLQNIPSDIPTGTKSLQIKHLLKYHYDSKHFHTSNFGNFSLISTPPFYSARDTGKHTNLMELLQIVWDDDTEKFSGLFHPNL